VFVESIGTAAESLSRRDLITRDKERHAPKMAAEGACKVESPISKIRREVDTRCKRAGISG